MHRGSSAVACLFVSETQENNMALKWESLLHTSAKQLFAFSWSFKAVGRENRTLPGIFVLCVCTSILRGCCRLFPWLPLWPMSDSSRSNTRAPFLRLDYNVPHVCSSTPLALSFQKKKKTLSLWLCLSHMEKKKTHRCFTCCALDACHLVVKSAC